MTRTKIIGRKNKEEDFVDWLDNCPAFEKDCTDSWEEKDNEDNDVKVLCYYFKVFKEKDEWAQTMTKTKIIGRKKEIKPNKKWDSNVTIILERFYAQRGKDIQSKA